MPWTSRSTSLGPKSIRIVRRAGERSSGRCPSARKGRWRPDLERLGDRVLMAVDVTAFNVAAGTATFTGDRGSRLDNLQLSQTTVGPNVYLSHNLIGGGGTGSYADNTDVDPGAGFARIRIGSGTSPLITVNLGTNSDTLALADSWSFGHKIHYNAGTGSDTLQGPNSSLTWNITGNSGSTYSGNITDTTKFTFSALETVRGGTAADTLVGRNVASTWSLAATGSYRGGAGNLTFSGFDVLQGGTAADAFSITANTSADLKGGPGNDSFTFGAGIVLNGSIDGEAGGDTLSLDAYTTAVAVALSGATADGFAGGATGVVAGFLGIDSLIGGEGSDTLIGADLAATWDLDDTPTYTAAGSTLGFSAFESLQGGTGADRFALLGDGLLLVNQSLKGGPGADSFDFSDGVFVVGDVDGEGGTDTLNYSAYSTGIVARLTGPATADGYSGLESLGIGGAFAGIDVLAGSAGLDSLTGEDADSTWTIAAVRTYQANSAPGSLVFSSIEALQGGAGADLFDVAVDPGHDLKGGDGDDTFAFRDGVSSAFTVIGEAGNDLLDLAASTTDVAVALVDVDADGFSGSSTAVAGFLAIDAIAARGTSANVLDGLFFGTWDLDATQSYVSGPATLAFSGFRDLRGGAGIDTFNVLATTAADLTGNGGNDSFVFGDGAVLIGTAAGGDGTDTFDLGAYSTDVTVTLNGSTADGFSGASTAASGFVAIDRIAAGSGPNNTIVGEDVDSTWTVSGLGHTYSDGGRSLDVATFQTFQGGSAADAFTVAAGATATLRGGAGADRFAIADGATLTGSIDGETGPDALDLAAYTTPTYVDLARSTAADGFAGDASGLTGGFVGIDDLVAGASESDSLLGLDATATWTLGGAATYADGIAVLGFAGFEALLGGLGSDRFDIEADTAADLYGGDGDDQFRFATDGVVLDGAIDGEDGVDALDYSSYTSSIAVNLADASATGTRGFAGIESLTGGSGADSLVAANQTNAWSITASDSGSVNGGTLLAFSSIANLTGGALEDTFAFADGAGIAGKLDGGGGTDTLDFSAFGAARGILFNVSSNNGGTVASPGVTFAFASAENLAGGAGDDRFAIGSGRTIAGTIGGGAGRDTLDYSAYTTTVRANLATGSATGIRGGAIGSVTGVEDLTGGSGADVLIGDAAANVLTGNGGNDVLTGGAGDDTLHGDAGRDVLIGGNGADSIFGGSGDDILVAGRTSFDSSVTDLLALMAEWGRTDASYATRVDHLNGTLAGGRNGARLLTAATVFDDTAIDSLSGGSDQDWFLAFVSDLVTDQNNGGAETLTRH